MATVSGKIYQVKDGTANLFPRTVIEAVYGLDKTIADVKTWVGNNYQTKYTFTISGTSGATYNLTTIATQAANGNSAYNSLSNYLPLTGGTLSGDVTTNANIYLLGTNSFSAIVKKNIVTSGGWARSFLQISNNSDELLWVLGAFGEAQGLTYVYFGSSGFASDDNIRFYNSGTVRANTFQKVGGTSTQFLKADGSVDSNTYITTSAAAGTYLPKSGGQMTGPLTWKDSTALPEATTASFFLTIDAFASGGGTKWVSLANVKTSLGLANYLPLAAQGATVYRTTSGQIVDFNNSKGAYEEAFFTISSIGTRRSAVGWNTTYGTYIYNYASAKYLGIKPDGTPHYQGNTLWHSGNANLSTVPWTASTLTANKLRITTKHNSSSKAGGIYYYDGTTDYLLIGQGSSNLWIGANETAGTHHTGSTYISTGGVANLFASKLVGGTRTNAVILDALNYYAYPAHSLRDYDYHNDSHRRTAGNVTFADGGLHYFLATSSMTDAGRPGRDGHILQCAWDNGTWDTQMFLPDGGITTEDNAHVKVRGQNGQGSWNDWHTLYDDVNLNKSKIISIVGTFPEAYLGWGGRNLESANSPIDAALCDQLGANRFAFAKTAGIDIFYSRDSGSTWTDFGAADSKKLTLTSGGNAGLVVGNASASSPATTAYRLKIVMYANNCGIYTNLNKFIIGVSTYGSNGCWCTLRGQTKANYNAGNDTWTTFAEKVTISGWPGKNVINTTTFTYGSGDSHFLRLEFTFGFDSGTPTSSYYGLTIQSIYAYGGVGWTEPSNMAYTGHLYSWDYSQTAYFPSGIRPSVSGSSLGVSSNRWALYATTGNFSGAVSTPQISGLGRIEFDGTSSSSGNGGYIDFHYNGSTADYTSRIIESASGTLSLNGQLHVHLGGNVGIGTTAPAAKLDVSGDMRVIATGSEFAKFLVYQTNPYGIVFSSESNGTMKIQSRREASAQYFNLVLNPLGGNVGIGTTSPTYKLDVTGVIRATVGIFSDGYVSALGTASSSDAKLKDNITTISYDRAKAVLSALNPREWTWNALTSKEGERGAGMVAQEVEPILPDTVKEIGGNLTLEYNTLFAYGLAATKYMLPMMETHEEKIARLEKEVEELKRQLTN